MKLIECYIENFGKLSAYRLKFNDGMNSYVYENGYGKTTLTEFIKAMLYGLSDTKKTDISENDRRHYLPWGGGVCGGWLSFSANGKNYRVERSFGAKAQDDTFAIYDLALGKETSDYTENLGRELFGIDRDGFLRTVFLSERNLSGKNENKSISEKLSDTTGIDYDIGAMDEALKLLDERRRFYYKRGGSGEISSAEAELRQAERELTRLDEMRKEYSGLTSHLSEIKSASLEIAKKRTEAEKQIEQIGREKEEMALGEHYRKLKEEQERKKERLSKLNEFFKNGIPSQDEIREASIAKMRSEEMLSRGFEPQESEELYELSKKLSGISKEDITRSLSLSVSRKKAFSPLLLSLGVIATILGIVMLFTKPIIAAFSLPMGAILLILSIFVVKNNTSSSDFPQNIKSSLELFGYTSDALGIQKLYGDFTRFELLAKERENLAEKKKAILNDAKELADIAEKFLSRYSVTSAHPFEEISALLSEREAIIKSLSDFPEVIPSYTVKKEYTATDKNPNELLSEVIKSQSELEQERLQTERRLSVIESELEREDDLYSAYEAIKRKIELYKSNLFFIQKAKDFLESAKDSMTSRYLTKAKDSFERYIKLISDESSEYMLDTSFEVSKSEFGAARKSELFSLGVRNMQYLATRLALTDALYENEAPFLIFDDPFVSFDDERTKNAISVLKKLSETRQIIYLTCSSSRKIQ